jgi:hypothetical protein
VPVVLKRGAGGHLFTVSADAALVLEDIIIDGSADDGFADVGGALVAVASNSGLTSAVFVMNDGAVLQNNSRSTSTSNGSEGGGVQVAGRGTFIMNGGKISGNASGRGGGVGVHYVAEFIMNGGEISGNTVVKGGLGGGSGVHVGGIFTMNDGKISGNNWSGVAMYIGADGINGVMVQTLNIFTMNGGEISGNTTTSTSGVGGVGLISSSTFAMNGGKISGNAAVGTAGAAYVQNSTFTMSGGEISGNTASGGGGVLVASGTFTMIGGEISGNTVNSNGGGVYVAARGIFTMSGGEISGNTANSNGGGVYVDNGIFMITGGVVTGADMGVNNVIFVTTNNSIAIAWNKPDGNGPFIYAEGAGTHLTVLPAAAAVAVWTKEGGKSGIAYESGSNAGFIEIAGVTVTTQDDTYDAQTPAISAQPAGGIIGVGDYLTLSVSAAVNDGGTLSYQWYSNTVAANSGGTIMTGETSSSYSVYASTVGTSYYYVIVTNTNNSVNGSKTAAVTSDAATVKVDNSTAVLSPDRSIQQNSNTKNVNGGGDGNAAYAGVFTAGPNPVTKLSGNVNFFWQGKNINNAALTVYDASGNVINKVKITDKALNTQARRTVGSWDLKDSKGRAVSEGSYLVKGVIKSGDGKSERISLILGVR